MGFFELRDIYNAIVRLFEQQFPCQTCGKVFQREMSGSLLCKECRTTSRTMAN